MSRMCQSRPTWHPTAFVPPQGVRMPPKLREKHEPVEVRVGTLPVPERPYKTTFVGANPWGV